MSAAKDDALADPASRDAPLEAGDIGRFDRDGWLARPDFFTATQAFEIARWTDELVALPEVPGRHMVYYEDSLTTPGTRVLQRIEAFCEVHAGFDALVRSGPLLAAAAQLLGGPAVLFKEKINFKKPGGGGFQPHQDQQAGWSKYAPMFVTALVTIDAATMENGCLEMPGGARVGGLIGTEWTPLTAEALAAHPLRPVPSAPGDVLFFDSYAPHASQPNRTDRQRRILYLTYNRADAGDHRRQYYADKRASFPPDVERAPGAVYAFRV